MPRPGLKRAILRAARRGAAALALLAAALVAFVEARWTRTFDAPLPALRARTDAATIARGRYLAYGPAHCASCHVAPADRPALRAGREPPLAGGSALRLPVGTWYMPNLTPDRATGIGRRSDGQIARALRHNLRHDGRVLLPAMEFQRLADEDVVAILSFLRAQPPVRHAVPEHEIGFVARAVSAFLARPRRIREAPPPATAPAGAGVARGAYLANEVASCDGCHTRRNLVNGRYEGPPYAGGTRMADETRPGHAFVTPRLAPSRAGAGPAGGWTEAQFVARFRAGRTDPASPMAWEAFTRMTDGDLRAIYRYLRTLPPAAAPEAPRRLVGVR